MYCIGFIITALLSLHSLTLLIGCIPVVGQPRTPLSDIPTGHSKSHHHPSVVLPCCQSTLNGFSLDLPSTKTRQCPVEHTDIPGGAMAAKSGGGGQGILWLSTIFTALKNNWLKQTESHWAIRWIYLPYLHGCTFVDTHPDREARDATCFAFICAPIILIVKPTCPDARIKVHKMAFRSTLITAKSTTKIYPNSVYYIA